MKITILVCLLSIVIAACSDRLKRGAGGWSITKISCNSNPKYVTDALCTLKSKNRQEMLISFGFTLKVPQSSIKLRFKHSKKANNNRYTSGLFDAQGDLCDLADSIDSDQPNLLKTAILKFEPDFRTIYKPILHSCPYKGPNYLYNITASRSADLPMMDLILITAFKIDVTIQLKNGEHLYTWILYYSKK